MQTEKPPRRAQRRSGTWGRMDAAACCIPNLFALHDHLVALNRQRQLPVAADETSIRAGAKARAWRSRPLLSRFVFNRGHCSWLNGLEIWQLELCFGVPPCSLMLHGSAMLAEHWTEAIGTRPLPPGECRASTRARGADRLADASLVCSNPNST